MSPYFWSDVLANLLPDVLIALILGFWLSRRLQRRETEVEVNTRRNEILALIKHELEQNILFAQRSLKNVKVEKLELSSLTTELWDFFTSSGQLKWLSNDLERFNKLANLYHYIRSLVLLEGHLLNAFVQFSRTGRNPYVKVLIRSLVQGYESFISAAREFLDEPNMMSIKTDMFTFLDEE